MKTRLAIRLCPILLCLFASTAHGQQTPEPWNLFETGVKASLRGLCVVDANTVWASGSGGTVIRTHDGGQNWDSVSPEGAEELDFRDIHAFGQNRAVILSAGQPARIYRTEDGGKSWIKCFEHPNDQSFFDALSFWDSQHGIAMSDPVDDRVLLIESTDGGRTWSELTSSRRPPKERGEAGFAASGTNMQVVGKNRVFIALGGAEQNQVEPTSRIVYSYDRGQTWKAASVPMPRSASGGIFSIAFSGTQHGIAVGGDYLDQDSTKGVCAISNDGGKTWTEPTGKTLRGYRSGVATMVADSQSTWVAVGPKGTDLSTDGGQNWRAASNTGFHAVQFVPNSNVGFASGSEGRVARWVESK